ncbi:MAG: recombinase RecT [Synergistaceae bacterium]|nr:recombinase RecT [Synergistaceae bacterium]
MAAEIVKAEQQGDLGLVPNWTQQQVDTIRRTVAKGATQEELDMFLHLSRTYGLDPFAKEIWFIKMGREPIIFTSRDGYLKIANRDPRFDGMEADVVYAGDSFRKTKDGVEHVYGAKDRGAPIGAYCIVHRSDRRIPTYVFAPYKDYHKGGNWNTYPHAMILKVAEAQALKRAFSISGLVTREEIIDDGGRPRAAAGPSRQTKREIWDRFLEYWKDAERAKAEILKLTGGRGSQEWTEEDLSRLEAKLDEYLAEDLGEASWTDEPLGEGAALDAEVVEEPKEDPHEAMTREAEELLGAAGLYLTGGEKEQFIFERTKKTALGELTTGELSGVIRDARKLLDERTKAEA